MDNLENRKSSNLALLKQIMRLLFHFNSYFKHRIVFVGDSHAVFIRQGLRIGVHGSQPINSLLFWIGPRLMYSVSKSGFPTTVLFKIMMWVWRPKLVVISLGEIDIRMFLHDTTLRNAEWVYDYLQKVEELRVHTRIESIYVLSGIPVSDLPPTDVIERMGTLSERLEGYRWLQSEIQTQLSQFEEFVNIHYIDLGNSLVGIDGSLSRDYSNDGIHVNSIGAWKVWDAIMKCVTSKK